MNFENQIWALKYAPKTIDEYVFHDSRLEKLIRQSKAVGIFPNLILAGVQGTGKSSLARLLPSEFDLNESDVKFIDGSTYNKVDDIRNIVQPFAQISPMGKFRLIVIEEAHRLSKDSQAALYETIERNADDCRFIFTTNYPQKFEPAILSRFQTFIFSEFNEEGALDLIERIMEAESVEVDEESLDNVMDHVAMYAPDIRAIVSSIQYSYFPDEGKIDKPSAAVKSSALADWEAIWSKDKLSESDIDDLLGMVHHCDSGNFDMFYQTVYELGLHHFENKGATVVTLSDYIHRATTTAIQSIHLEAFLHEVFTLAEQE